MPWARRIPGGDRVHELAHGVPRAPSDPGADERSERDPAPHSEPALPHREDPAPLRVGHLVPTRDVVVGARADDPRCDAPDRDAEDQIPVARLGVAAVGAVPGAPFGRVRPAQAGQPDARQDARQEHQAVHVDRQRAEGDPTRVRRRDGGEYGEHAPGILPRAGVSVSLEASLLATPSQDRWLCRLSVCAPSPTR